MRSLPIFLIILFIFNVDLNAQLHIDTVRIKGYYIIDLLKFEQRGVPKKRINDSTVEVEYLTDIHRQESFIPMDSITGGRRVSYWLRHLFDGTDKVFISCAKFCARDFLPREYKRKYIATTCSFPDLNSETLYETTDRDEGDVFEIYYLDADWVKIPIDKRSVVAHIVPGTIAQSCIKPNVKFYDLYCFLKCYSFETYPVIQDDCIGIWDKMSEK